tara:strand:- start:310 stop:432 length:123 start_codon:yes stop_codon:yes gene_type:complete
MIAKIINAKNMNMGTMRYLDDWGSEPEIIEGFIEVIACIN